MRNTTCAACLLLLVVFSAPVHAEGDVASLAAARELYVAASYDEALMMLGGLSNGSRTLEELQSIDLYRTLCLFALGRGTEADHVIDAMLMREPLYRTTSEELSPRVLGAFQTARRRLLPAVIQREYNEAKAAFDKQDFSRAADGFGSVLKSIGDPDIATMAGAPPLSDLRTLASSFRDLSVKLTPPPPPKVEAKPVRVVKAVYGPEDRDVMPPLAIQQRVPKYPAAVTRPMSGVVEFVVDEAGAVLTPSMQIAIDPMFDQMVISAAKKWVYQPATLEGKPVKYIKRLTITVTVPAPQPMVGSRQ